MLGWFEKAKKDPAPKKDPPPAGPGNADKSAAMQGSYTDHHENPLKIRQQLAPMHGAELEAFNYCMKILDESYPKHSFLETVEEGINCGMFEIGDQGELREAFSQ